MPGGRGDVKGEFEEEETVCGEAGGRVALCDWSVVGERELGGGDGGGGGRGEGEAVEGGKLRERVRREQRFSGRDFGGGRADDGE